MDQFLLLRPSLTSRHQLHREIPQDTVLDAAATAIECGEVETAVEFLEQGRTLLWSQMNRYRTPLDELQRAHPKLATDFTRLSQLLENSATSGITRELCKMTLEEETRRYRKIAEDWSTVVDQIRQMDGFENFLRPPDYSFLRLSSRKGPVIMINVGSKRCDAIIIHQENNPVLVPLLDVRKSDIQVNADKFHSETRAGVVDRSQILGVLRALWDDIVQPVVTKLHELNVVPGSRIWWCPTSVLSILPIHAAGPHRRNKLNLCDIYISSYTPTLSTLVGLNPAIPPVGQQNQLHYDPRLLVVAQPDTPGQVHIPGVNKELSAIKMHVPDSNVLLSGGGTSDAVLTGLKTHSWVHITCHGSQDFKDPFASCFHLYDKSLTLLDIIDARAPSAEFGFLSACHSAASDIRRPDETLHLAAALQFTGFRSVIGTMYAMADVDGPIVAEEVYKHMYRRKEKSGSVDYRDAAEGLSIATKKLKERGVPVERWINFVHFGA
ncbi:hypothetical protein FRC02_006155 [Tulasnella sp. 418]|nr:hypothetical protein FRC02_006155 [Tulasnella sp. 418]